MFRNRWAAKPSGSVIVAETIMKPSTRATAIELLLIAWAVLFVAAIIQATEPPQCNLPGWQPPTVRSFRTVQTTRAPHGHTHTCAHGHTWDHDANPTHTCQFCGMTQYVVDRSPRPVTVVRTVAVDAPVAQVVQTHTFDHQAVFAIPGLSAGGCANGQCSTISNSRGFLRR